MVSGRPVRPILTLLIQLSSNCSASTPASVTTPKVAGSRTLPAATKPSIAQVADWIGHASDAAVAHATSKPANVHRSHAWLSLVELRER